MTCDTSKLVRKIRRSLLVPCKVIICKFNKCLTNKNLLLFLPLGVYLVQNTATSLWTYAIRSTVNIMDREALKLHCEVYSFREWIFRAWNLDSCRCFSGAFQKFNRLELRMKIVWAADCSGLWLRCLRFVHLFLIHRRRCNSD